MALQLQVDEAAITRLLAAFDTTQSDCTNAQREVSHTTSVLSSNWQGNASSAYQNALTTWEDGLNKVLRGLNMINDQMVSYRGLTANTEQETTQHAAFPTPRWT